jgi:hypothetical protein
MNSAMATVRQVVKMVREALKEDDRVALVTFSDNGKVLLPLSNPRDESISGIIESLTAGGSTNIMGGLNLGLNMVLNKPSDSRSRLTLLMLLTDGAPNIGLSTPNDIVAEVKKHVAKFVDLPVIPQLVIHSFGFTTEHKPAILRGVTSAGNGGSGLYYFMNTHDDITSGIGDCLGSVTNVQVYGVRLSATPLGADGQPLPGWVCFFYTGKELPSLTEPPTPFYSLGYLAANEQRNVIAVAQPLSAAKKAASFDSPTSILVRVFYCDASSREELSTSFQGVVLQGGSSNPEVVAHQLHVQTHVLRLRVADSLNVISSGQRNVNLAPHEQVHELILQTLNSVQENATQSPSNSLMEDESILLSLEKDLGQALETTMNNLSAKDLVKMQQYSHEHANQRSASNATELRATYSLPEQTEMRSKFGNGAEQQIEAIAKEEKAKVVLE